jgi:hypothetical protein
LGTFCEIGVAEEFENGLGGPYLLVIDGECKGILEFDFGCKIG